MKTTLLSIISVLGTLQAVSAQPSTQPPAPSGRSRIVSNSTMIGQKINAQINAQVAGSDEEDGEQSPPQGPPPLVPKNPNSQKYEGGRIVVVVSSNRHFGYHIGDIIALEIQIQADNDVLFDFSALQQGTFKVAGSSFTIVAGTAPTIAKAESRRIKNTSVYKIDLQVQCLKKLDAEMVFNIDLSYALDPPTDRKKIKWGMLTTPDFVLSMTTLADTGKELLEGDISLGTIRISWAAFPLLSLGLFIIVWFGGIKDLVGWINRTRKANRPTAERQAWKVFNKVFADASDYRQFTPIYAQKIATALRQYFNVESLSLEQIAASRSDDANLPLLLAALGKCQEVIYARVDKPVILTDSDIASLSDTVSHLVPKEPTK